MSFVIGHWSLVIGQLGARSVGMYSRGGAEYGAKLVVQRVHCNLREKPGQIFEDFFKPEM